MKILTLVQTEFRRLTATGLARLALVALMLVPVIYAGLYLWANSDPYGNIKNIPVALVVEDTGSTLDGKAVDYGTEVRDQLIADESVKWIEATADQAASGVRNGEYDFVLTLGPDFSTLLTSAGTAMPQQAVVQLTTNDTNSFLASSIAATVAEKVRLSISEKVGEAAALQFLNGFATIHDNLSTAVDGSNQLVDGTAQAQTGAASLASGAATLDSGAQSLSSGAATAASGAATLSSGAARAASGASTLADGVSRLSSGASTLSAGAAESAAGAAQLSGGVASLPAESAKLNAGAQGVADGNASLAGSASTVAQAAQDAVDEVPAARSGIAADLKTIGLTESQIADVLARLDPLGAAVESGNEEVQGLNGKISQLSNVAGQVAAGTQKLADAAPGLASGAAALATGTQQVAEGASTLADSSSQLAGGAASLATGTSQVADGAASLASGTQQLADGASTLAGGTQQLADGANALSTGAGQLNGGAVQLRDGLVSGVDRIPNSAPDQRQTVAATIATPARVDTDTVTKATTYGAGMAPFFISLAAWIGIYALFLIIKPLSKRALTAIKAPLRVTAAGWLAPALLGALQMAVVYFVVTVPLGFSVANPALMLLFMMFTSVTFVAIIGALNIWLGSVGQFLGLVLMVLQLVTAGGTFPWQTLPGPLAALHHLLPMSYAVDGIRQLMYGGDLSLALGDAGIIAVWLLAAIAFSVFLAGRKTAARTLRDLRPSLIG